MKNISKPTLNDNVEQHPAYGTIHLSRVSGDSTLFDSEFKHQHCICLEIMGAEVQRDLSTDSIFPKRQTSIVQVYMSENQFATFITSMGLSSGTPCTLNRINNTAVDGIDNSAKKDAYNDHREEITSAISESLDTLTALSETVKDMKISAKNKSIILNELSNVEKGFVDSTPFIFKLFGEYAENVRAKAMAEINSYIDKTKSTIKKLT